ncbi:MAG: quinolinate synthase NadA [Candidatus Omnitrophica bacterium]|nr:quinolinate synthase NadA [Candidatus Omnitrophota bacterium]
MNKNLVEKILELKKKRNAIILAHNYQLRGVKSIANYIGDSLGLSRTASQTNADVIVFCGVHFMAETASILCPKKIVLIPDINAGCPMVDMITREELKALKREHPQAAVVGYVNTSAEVKAELDICCTSTNAIKVVESLKDVEEIIFVPDKYLADYVSTKTNKKLIPWNGYCPTHVKILPEDILKQKKIHPKAEVIVHPECTPPVIQLADRVLSTDGMCKYAGVSSASEIIVGTELGLLYRLQKENPEKKFYPASEQAICPNMKLTTLEKVLRCLEDMKYEVKVPEEICCKAKKAIDRMLEIE